MEEPQKKNGLFIFIIIFIAVGAILFSNGNSQLNNEVRLIEEREMEIWAMLDSIPLEAKAVSIFNITENKKIYGRNDRVAMPIASLAKTMTAVVGLNKWEKKETISISREALSQVGDYGLLLYEKWNTDDLAKLTLIASSNDGAYALIESNENFLDTMNVRAKRIGMENTSFLNPTGLDLIEEGLLTKQASAFASAEDANTMAMFGLRAYPEIFSVTTLPEINLTSLSGFSHNFKNTNIVIDKIPNLLFSKTGYTDVAGGSLTVIFRNEKGHDFAVTILGSGFEARFSDMEKIVGVLHFI